MTFKSVYKVKVDKAEFEQFEEQFKKFDALLAKMPAAWAETGRAQVAATMAMAGINQQVAKEQNEQKRREKEEQDRLKKQAQETAAFWQNIGHSTDRVLANVSGITRNFLTWSGLTGMITGLLGIGGSIYGLDRLAGSVGNSRVQAAGLGVTTGEQRAFDINYRRLVQNPEGLLSNVASARSDYSKRGYFSVLGINDIDHKGTAELAIEVIDKAASIFAKNPTKQYADATGLTHFLSMEDIRSSSAGDRTGAKSGFLRDTPSLGFSDETARKWQEFSIKMSRASATLESALANGLSDLAPQLGKLTDSLAHLIDVSSHSPKVREWIDDVVGALDRMSKFLDKNGSIFSPGSKIDNLTQGNSPEIAASAAAGFAVAGPVGAVGAVLADGASNIHIARHDEDKKYTAWQRLKMMMGNAHNPGNLRKWGNAPTFQGFARFGSDEEGLHALGAQLRLYEDRDHLDSIRGIVSRYAPASENDTESYIKFVSEKMGMKGRDTEHIDLHNGMTLANMMEAIVKKEGALSYAPDKAVFIKISNQIGANITSNSNQAAVATP